MDKKFKLMTDSVLIFQNSDVQGVKTAKKEKIPYAKQYNFETYWKKSTKNKQYKNKKVQKFENYESVKMPIKSTNIFKKYHKFKKLPKIQNVPKTLNSTKI